MTIKNKRKILPQTCFLEFLEQKSQKREEDRKEKNELLQRRIADLRRQREENERRRQQRHDEKIKLQKWVFSKIFSVLDEPKSNVEEESDSDRVEEEPKSCPGSEKSDDDN
jgi:hypothetical protein